MGAGGSDGLGDESADEHTMIHYWYGEDSFAAREAMVALAHQEGAELEWLATDGLTPAQFTIRLSQGSSSLFGKKILVIREASRLPSALQERLVTPASHHVIAWDEGQPDRRSLVWRSWKDQGREFRVPGERELTVWLQAETQRRGGTISEEAIRALLERLGPDRWRLVSEVERLSLRHPVIDESVVAHHVDGGAGAGEVFELLSALVRGQRQVVVQQLEGLMAAGESEFYVLSMLAYQFRMLYLLARGVTRGFSPGVVRRNSGVARQRPASVWLEYLTRVVATDFAIKQGKTDPRTGVTMLMLGLMPTPSPVSQ